MRVLIVANHNTGSYTPFIIEQVKAIHQLGIEIDYFGVHGKGIMGYLSNRNALKAKIRDYHPDLIHAHYGLSGLLANLQRSVPVVTTYHGSDIHALGKNLFFSKAAMWLSAYNIFVSDKLQIQSGYHKSKQRVIPCGVDTAAIYPIDRVEARKLLGWDVDGKYVLFAGAFNNEVKNSSLAKAAMALLPNAQLVEMRGFNREQVNQVMNAADCLLMTSHREGSPQVIKEAMVCGTPIVSVNVGDVKEVLSGVTGCYITSYNAHAIVENLQKAFSFTGKTNGRQRISELGLSNESIAKEILNVYKSVVKR